jgi:hypothetical protein
MSAPTLFSYLSPGEAQAICKLAGEKKPNRALGALKAVGLPLLGWTGGTVAGFGAGMLADTISQKLMGHPIPLSYLKAVAPALGGAAGLSYGLYKAHEMEDLRRALEGHPDKPAT